MFKAHQLLTQFVNRGLFYVSFSLSPLKFHLLLINIRCPHVISLPEDKRKTYTVRRAMACRRYKEDGVSELFPASLKLRINWSSEQANIFPNTPGVSHIIFTT